MNISFDFTTVTVVLFVIGDFIIRVVSVIVVPRNRRPGAATAWLLAIYFMPYLGFAFFLLIGSRRLPRRRRKRQAEVDRYIRESSFGQERVSDREDWPEWFQGVVAMNAALGSMPLVGSNTARLLIDYRESLADMTAAVRAARHYVHVEFYIFVYDETTAPFFVALRDARARGVEVRVLFDHVASLRTPGYRRTVRELRSADIAWYPMLPIQPFRWKYQRPDLRNHRKLLVVDGAVGYLGSQNMVDAGYHRRRTRKGRLEWRELVARLEGPIVTGLDAIFATDWYLEAGELSPPAPAALAAAPTTAAQDDAGAQDDARSPLDCQVVPSGPGFGDQNNLQLFVALMHAAQEHIVISSPYFVPSESMLTALAAATRRGVRVELFVSEFGDQWLVQHAQCSYYEYLLQVGVRIFCYRAPTILHAKHVTVDESVAVIGSSNMDMRSFELNMEVSLLVHGASFVRGMRAIEAKYREQSVELTLDEWRRRRLGATILDNLARLTSALQ